MLGAPKSFFRPTHSVLYFCVGITYIQFYVFSGDSEHHLLSEFFETLAMILAIMTIPEAVVGWIVVKFAKSKICILKSFRCYFFMAKYQA